MPRLARKRRGEPRLRGPPGLGYDSRVTGRPLAHRSLFALAAAVVAAACGRAEAPAPANADSPSARPSILLVTLDTTRADSIGPEARGVETPAFDALAARGLRFRQAYATVPETLPSHASLLTGLHPAGHGVHENARYLGPEHPLLAERLGASGYDTAAFVSSFVLARRFGLARGFAHYDDDLPAGRSERSARETTDRALAWLDGSSGPRFAWVHYFDPHAPYEPPEPFRTRYAKAPYLGEVAAMDEQLGRLVAAFEQRAPGPVAILVASDHGEGLGDHGEAQHGNLVYQSTMRVPLVIVGPGVAPGVSDAPVSARRVFHTALDWAALGDAHSLRRGEPEIVLGEAMKPFLSYGWQPQVMAVEGRTKAILAGRLEAYDVVADPSESRDLGEEAPVSRPLRTALREYPVPSPGARPASEALGEEERRQLASLGYVSAGSAPVVRKDAPRPADMTRLFDTIDKASGLFVREEYARAVPLLERIRAEDPGNLDAALRLATAHSMLGQEALALREFERAGEIAPGSQDVRTYLALHYARGKDWARAVPLLEQVVAESPDRLPAVEALARVRERQGRSRRRSRYISRSTRAGSPRRRSSSTSASSRWAWGTPRSRSRRWRPPARARGQESHSVTTWSSGVLYLAERRFAEARDALDRVPSSHPGYPMALFKRAQVSVLLGEPDQAARIDAARRRRRRDDRGAL